MEITINNTIIKVKYGFKALMIYERIEDKAFNPTTLSDIILFFYCCVLSSNAELTYDDFIDWLDENPESIEEFSNYLAKTMEAKTLKKAQAKEKK